MIYSELSSDPATPSLRPNLVAEAHFHLALWEEQQNRLPREMRVYVSHFLTVHVTSDGLATQLGDSRN